MPKLPFHAERICSFLKSVVHHANFLKCISSSQVSLMSVPRKVNTYELSTSAVIRHPQSVVSWIWTHCTQRAYSPFSPLTPIDTPHFKLKQASCVSLHICVHTGPLHQEVRRGGLNHPATHTESEEMRTVKLLLNICCCSHFTDLLSNTHLPSTSPIS